MNLLFFLAPFFLQSFVRQDDCRVSWLCSAMLRGLLVYGIVQVCVSAALVTSHDWAHGGKQLCSGANTKTTESFNSTAHSTPGLWSYLLFFFYFWITYNTWQLQSWQSHIKIIGHCGLEMLTFLFLFRVVVSEIIYPWSSTFLLDLPLISPALCIQTHNLYCLHYLIWLKQLIAVTTFLI